MNNMSPFSSYSIAFMQESFFRPLRIHLTTQQKKVAIVALAIFSFVAACSLLYHFCFKAKKDLSLEGNIPQEGLFRQNALSPIAVVKKAHEATKILDFSNQVQEGKNEDKNDEEDQNLEVEDSYNEKEDLSPEVIEQDKIPPTPLPPPPEPLEESNPLNNEEVEKMAIESFPSEILAIIFKFLPISYRPAIVCRLWKEVFDEVHPIKLLQAEKFYKALKDRPLSYYAKDQKEFLRLQGAIQGNSLNPWMDKWIQQCGSEAEEACLWQNLWLTPFCFMENVSSPKIQKIMDLLKQKNIAIFFPHLHLTGLLESLSLRESLSYEEIESIKETIEEAIRLKLDFTIEDRYFDILDFIEKLFENLGIPLSVIQKGGKALKLVLEEKRTVELCLLAVQNHGFALEYVPEEKRTAELCLLAVQKDGRTLQYVPEEKRTTELCLLAVQKNGDALQYVPEEKRTAELCLRAVQKDGRTLQYVPEEKRTAEICLRAVQKDGWDLQYVPEEKRTAELCLLAVQKDGLALQYVPEEKRTAELYLLAVQKHRWTLRIVPKEKRTAKLCLLAVRKDGDALKYVPEEKRTTTLYLLAVKNDGSALEHVPKEQRTAELCLLAVQSDGDALKYVPEEKRTPELCLLAVQENGRALQFVPEEKRTEEICRAAVKQNGEAFQYVPERMRTAELYFISSWRIDGSLWNVMD